MFRALSHEADKFRAALADGVAMGQGMRIQSPAPGAEDFRGCSVADMARVCLVRAGYSEQDLGSRVKIADAVFRSRNAMNTGDFSYVLEDVSQKFLLKGYQESARTFWPLVDQANASDFKSRYGISLSEFPDLELVNESEEYKAGTLKDSAESYQVKKYGLIVSLTWEAVINDDLKSFTKRILRAGTAAARKESDLVWGLITGNPTMSDGKEVFCVDHGNLEGTLKGEVTSDRLTAARTAMRTQKDANGSEIEVYPSYLIVPVAQSTSAEVLLRSRANPETGYNSGVINPWGGLIPISEPRLDAVSTKAWYLAADPGQVDIIEFAYLEGNEEPDVFQEQSFIVDAINFKVRHCFGAGIMDFRGLFWNPGE